MRLPARRQTPSTNARLLWFLQVNGKTTAEQVRQRFGIVNVSARISELRRAGYAVYNNTRRAPDGTKIHIYQLGKPTRRVIAAGQLVLSDPYFRAILEKRIDQNLGLV